MPKKIATRNSMFPGPASGDWAGASAWAKRSESTADSFAKAGRSNRLEAPASTGEAVCFVQLAQRIQHDLLGVLRGKSPGDLGGGGAQEREGAARLLFQQPEDRRPHVVALGGRGGDAEHQLPVHQPEQPLDAPTPYEERPGLATLR